MSQDLERARRLALSALKSIREMVDALRAARDADDDAAKESARETIEQDALSVEVRNGWQSRGGKSDGPEEFRILLRTGGPAIQIHGELGQWCEPESATLQYQDWFTPWTDLRGPDLPDDAEEILLEYALCFYFGE